MGTRLRKNPGTHKNKTSFSKIVVFYIRKENCLQCTYLEFIKNVYKSDNLGLRNQVISDSIRMP